MSGYILVDTFCNNFLQQLFSVLKQANGPVCLRFTVVRLVKFINDHHIGSSLQMSAMGEI